MSKPDKKAIDAIWKTSTHNANEKLVLYYLITKHSLGHATNSSWRSISDFMSDFQEQFVHYNDVLSGTQLSEVKADRTIKSLVAKGYVRTITKPRKFSKRKKIREDEPIEQVPFYAITDKIFHEYQDKPPKN